MRDDFSGPMTRCSVHAVGMSGHGSGNGEVGQCCDVRHRLRAGRTFAISQQERSYETTRHHQWPMPSVPRGTRRAQVAELAGSCPSSKRSATCGFPGTPVHAPSGPGRQAAARWHSARGSRQGHIGRWPRCGLLLAAVPGPCMGRFPSGARLGQHRGILVGPSRPKSPIFTRPSLVKSRFCLMSRWRLRLGGLQPGRRRAGRPTAGVRWC